MSDSLYLTRIPIDGLRLSSISARPTLAPHTVDTGYLVHSQLAEVFGLLAPKPFALIGTEGRTVQVLGYSRGSPEALVEYARTHGKPEARAGIHWPGVAGKQLPARFPQGHRLRFCVRTCPVVRKNSDGPRFRTGAEIDVFMAEVEKVGKEVAIDRQRIYKGWFEAAVARAEGMRCLALGISAMKRLRLTRRASDRKPTILDRPDVTFEGLLEVTEPKAFRALIARGIGRHRAFGFGMLLLRPL